jgi:hypothetical protein
LGVVADVTRPGLRAFVESRRGGLPVGVVESVCAEDVTRRGSRSAGRSQFERDKAPARQHRAVTFPGTLKNIVFVILQT